MPAIYYIIKRFLARYQPIQKNLEEVQYQLEVEKFMLAIRNMPAEELEARLAASQATIKSLNQSVAEMLKNFNLLIEAEEVRHELKKATFEEIRRLNEAVTNELRNEAEKWH